MNGDPSEGPKQDPNATTTPTNRTRPDALPGARSLLSYAPALILLLAVVVDSMQYADPDLWGHVRFGQTMLM